MRRARHRRAFDRRRLVSALVLLCGLSALAAAALASSPRARVGLVSRNSSGKPANGDSSVEGGSSSISANGRVVAFFSQAANLPSGDGSIYQIYARDMKTGRTRLASVTSNGNAALSNLFGPAISADGRFVVFYGTGAGLPGADGAHDQVWIHDRRTGATRLVSRGGGGAAGKGSSTYPSASANGRFVAFRSFSSNLPGGDGVNSYAYLRDMRRGRTILISRTATGAPAFGSLYGQSVSSDGRRVVFYSKDADLPGGDGSTNHVYLRDLRRGRTILLDRTSAGKIANDYSVQPSISGNGRFVAFESTATNLGASAAREQVFLRDLVRRKTILVSRTNSGQKANGNAFLGHPSASGRSVAFEATATNLPQGDAKWARVYVRELRRRSTRLLSRRNGGGPVDGYFDYPSISADGRWVSFYGGIFSGPGLGGNPAFTNVFRFGPLR